ncbi:MAG TPA: glycosyltransferase N-terminal domain-containing protein, partial [Rhodocyclaceae bacterium]
MKAEAGGLGWRLSLFLVVYRAVWYLLAPGVLAYFWRRGKREPVYRQFFDERFGGGGLPAGWNRDCRPVWVHCASLGEFRGAAPLIRAMLDSGLPILFTTVTPAGRGAAQSLFAAEIEARRMAIAWSPLEFAWAVRRLVARYRPHCAMMCEIDTWPVLVTTIRQAGVPLAMANAQYPGKSLVRDERWGG